MKLALIMLIALPVIVVLVGQIGFFSGTAPNDLGVSNERFKPPSITRNSVSSQATLYPDHPQLGYAQVAPLPLLGGAASESMAALQSVLAAEPGVRITMGSDAYIRATARTPWLGFVDDLEFWLNPVSNVIEVRSASRLGREDFGTNRARLERIRAAYTAIGLPNPSSSSR